MGDEPTKKERVSARIAHLRDTLVLVNGVAPNPCELSSEIDLDYIEEYRHLDCVNYATCMYLAGIMDWGGFGCRACGVFKTISKTIPKMRKVAKDVEQK